MPNSISTTTRIALILSLTLLVALALFLPSAGAAKPQVGKPPIPGKYVLTPHYDGTGPGSVVVKRDGSHGFTALNIRIRLPQKCESGSEVVESYAGKTARVVPALHLKRFVAHRVLENEVDWGVSGTKIGKRIVRTHEGNARAIIDGRSFPATIDLLFFRGIPAFKPVEGDIDIDLSEVAPELECFLSWEGHRSA